MATKSSTRYGATIAGKRERLRDFRAMGHQNLKRDPRAALQKMRPGDDVGFWLYDGPAQTGTPMGAKITRVLGPNHYEGRMDGVKPYGGSRVVFGRQHVSHLNDEYLYETRRRPPTTRQRVSMAWRDYGGPAIVLVGGIGVGYLIYKHATRPEPAALPPAT